MVWAGKLKGHREMDRVYGPDLMLEVACAWSEQSGCRHFFYGGAEGVAELLAERLQARFPRLKVAGTFTPPFRPLNPDEEEALPGNGFGLQTGHFLELGLSTPKQEEVHAGIPAQASEVTLMVGVGAAFDFHSGRVKQAPRWMQRSGLEWLFIPAKL